MRITKLKPLKKNQYRCGCCDEPTSDKDQNSVKFSTLEPHMVMVCSSCKKKIGQGNLHIYQAMQEIKRHMNIDEIGVLIHDMDNTQIERLLARLKESGTL